jgi:hypothetical protein
MVADKEDIMDYLEHNKILINGGGKCSVPLFQNGCPAGFCDKPAYGFPIPCKEYRNAYTGRMERVDGRYNGYVPYLACPTHGGPEKNEIK